MVILGGFGVVWCWLNDVRWTLDTFKILACWAMNSLGLLTVGILRGF